MNIRIWNREIYAVKVGLSGDRAFRVSIAPIRKMVLLNLLVLKDVTKIILGWFQYFGFTFQNE